MSSTDLPTLTPFQSGFGVSLGLAVIIPIIFYAVTTVKENSARQRGSRSMSIWACAFLAFTLACAWYCTATPVFTQGVVWDGTTVPVVPIFQLGVSILSSLLVCLVFSYFGHSDPMANMPMDTSEEATPLNRQAAHPLYSRNHWVSNLGTWATVTYLFYVLPWVLQQNDPTILWYAFGVSMAGAIGYIAAGIRAIIYITETFDSGELGQVKKRRFDKYGACMAILIIFFFVAAAVPVGAWISPAVATLQTTYTVQTSLIVSLCLVYATGLVALVNWFYFDWMKFSKLNPVAAGKGK